MRLKQLPVVGLVAIIAAPAFAITVNVSDFVFPGAPTVSIAGGPAGTPNPVLAGEFAGTMTDDSLAASGPGLSSLAFTNADATGTSFNAWCAELSQSFSFGTNYTYQQETGTVYFGTPKLDALSRLFTAAQGFVVDSTTSAAMQAGIWEIIYEQGPAYDIGSGTFTVTPQDPAGQAAFNTVNSFLTNLSRYSASYHIDVLESDSSQDFLVPTIPEPSSWAFLLGGLGAMGYIGRRRRKAELGSVKA